MGRKAASSVTMDRRAYEDEDDEEDARMFRTVESPRIRSYEEEIALLAKKKYKNEQNTSWIRVRQEVPWQDTEMLDIDVEYGGSIDGYRDLAVDVLEDTVPCTEAEEPCSEPIVKSAGPQHPQLDVATSDSNEELTSESTTIKLLDDKALQTASTIVMEEIPQNVLALKDESQRLKPQSRETSGEGEVTPREPDNTLPMASTESLVSESKLQSHQEANLVVENPRPERDQATVTQANAACSKILEFAAEPNPPPELPSCKNISHSPRRRILTKKYNASASSHHTQASALAIPRPDEPKEALYLTNFDTVADYSYDNCEGELANHSAMVVGKLTSENPFKSSMPSVLMDDIEHYDIEIEKVTRELEELNMRQQEAKNASLHRDEIIESYSSLFQKQNLTQMDPTVVQGHDKVKNRKRRFNEELSLEKHGHTEDTIPLSDKENGTQRKSPRKLDPLVKRSEPSYAKSTQSRVSFVNAPPTHAHTLRAPDKTSKIANHSPTRRTNKPTSKISEVSKVANTEKPTTLPPLVSPNKTNPLGVPAHILEEGGVYPWSKLMQQVIVPHGTDSPVVYVPIFNPAYIAEVKKHIVEPTGPVKEKPTRQKKSSNDAFLKTNSKVK